MLTYKLVVDVYVIQGVMTMAKKKGRNRKSFERILSMYKYKNTVARLSNYPVLKQLGWRHLDMDNTTLTYIPVYENLELPAGTAAPISIIERFIREASHHLILSCCPCRSENQCQDFDPDFGCTFLGPAVLDVDPEVGRLVSMEEALEHLHQATEAGLVSCLGKFKLDAIMLGVRDHNNLMTICHCCPCCCLSTSIPHASRETRDTVVRLDGLSIAVDAEKCNGCGACEKVCMFKQIEVVDKMAVIGEECKGCGRCAMVCKQGAISVTIDDPSYIDACIARIGSKVDVGT
ncbi:MAG: 4Fe-4S ferredoxin [Actinobacteria bacterium]|jgi:Fe-S-cluster-containing hydrogenase component 2|nr:MAG: 4Fe-4S ferredoxin [Actinomycetota bacterium]